MESLRKIFISLFFIGWFFFPFNDFEGVEEFGEYKSEAGAYFFLVGFIILMIHALGTGRISIPYKSRIFQILLIFLAWCILTIVFNYEAVSLSYFKHTAGFMRFIRQYFSLVLAALIFVLFFWNVIKDMTTQDVLFRIRKVILISLIFTFVYGVLETMIVVFHLHFVRPIIDLFDYFPFLDVNFQPGDRISSVTWEAPSLGNFLITIAGWMFSYIFTEKSRYRFVPMLMILFLTFFSGSRTALINITLQLVILFIAMYRIKENRTALMTFLKYAVIVAGIFLSWNGSKIIYAFEEKVESLNFSDNLEKNVSNQTRFGMQYASIQVFKEHPIVGVGLGQEAYYKRFHYPGWAKKNNWEFPVFYENKNYSSFPPAYNIYTRLLAETGIIGVSIFIWLIYLCISGAKRFWNHGDEIEKILGVVLLISFVGLSVNWFQTDFFRQYGFWLCLVVLIKIYRDKRIREA